MDVEFLWSCSDQTARFQMEKQIQQGMQKHDAMLRQEVYLPAAEAIAQAQEMLGRAPLDDLARDRLRATAAQVAGAIGKAQLVATEASIRPLAAVAAELSKSQLGLLARRQPLETLTVELEELDRQIAQLAVERDHLLASLTRCAADTEADQQIAWHELNTRFDKTHREICSLLGQRKDKQMLKSNLEQALNVEVIQSALRLTKLAVPAYLALRDELRLNTPESEYHAVAQRSISELEKYLQTLLEPEQQRAHSAPPATETRAATVAANNEGGHEPKLKMVLKNL